VNKSQAGTRKQFCTGNDEVTWAYLDDGNSTGGTASVSVSGLAAMFPNGYVVQTIASEANVVTFDGVDLTDGTLDTNSSLTYSTYYVANPINDGTDLGGTVGLSQSEHSSYTGDTLNINCEPKTAGNRSTLAGFIITDMPVVSQSPDRHAPTIPGSFLFAERKRHRHPAAELSMAGERHQSWPGATASSYTNADAALNGRIPASTHSWS
jgi:hypothetical protein